MANRAFLNTQLFNESVANGWLFAGIDPVKFQGPALNLSIPAAYEYYKERLSAFTDLGVKGYKIDRGEEEEMPGKRLLTLSWIPLTYNVNSVRTKYSNDAL